MRVNDFLVLIVKTVKTRVPARWRSPNARARFTFVQVYYGRPSFHYEVWVRGKEKLLEVGLHFEADRATNASMLAYLADHIFEIKHALGERVELEQWTASWTRVHELLPYEHLDQATAEKAAARMAKMIETLQPIIEQCPLYTAPRSKRKKAA